MTPQDYLQFKQFKAKPKSFCREILGLNIPDMIRLNKLNQMGEESYASSVLGVTKERLDKLLAFESMSTKDKILSLVNQQSSIISFFNTAYVDYLVYKKNHKAKWKKQTLQYHLLEIKTIIDKALFEKFLSWEDARKVARSIFFAVYVSCHSTDRQQEKQAA